MASGVRPCEAGVMEIKPDPHRWYRFPAEVIARAA